MGRSHGPDDLRYVSSQENSLASQHLSDFSLKPWSSILWLWLLLLLMHPTRQFLVPLLLTTDASSQTLTVSGETAVHGDLFRKYWADTLLCRRGTLSTIISPHLASLHHATHGSLITAVACPITFTNPTRDPSPMLRNHRKDSASRSSSTISILNRRTSHPHHSPHVYRIK